MYYDCIRSTIQEGGDTDTNAAIVGGMIGALVGIKKIPSQMLVNVVKFDCSNIPKDEDYDSEESDDPMALGKKRPDFLSTKNHLFTNI